MPAILDAADDEAWLGSKDEAMALAVLRPYPAERTTCYAVSRRVNSPRLDDPECIAPGAVSA